MSYVFCPFTPECGCDDKCVFYEGTTHYKTKEDCKLAEAARNISELASSLSSIDSDVSTIKQKVDSIDRKA